MKRLTLDRILDTAFGNALGLSLARLSPARGYRLAQIISSWMSNMKSMPTVRAVRANQWIIHDRQPDARELDEHVRAVYNSSGQSLYEFWHFHTDDNIVKSMVSLDSSLLAIFERARDEGRGMVMVIPHIANFDLVGRAVVLNGYPLHILSYPNPRASYRMQNALRDIPGMKVTPMSIDALRQASQTLRSGGVVVTGVDRPLVGENHKYAARFFGFPAVLPVYHIRLALKHDLPVVAVGIRRTAQGRYTVYASEPVAMRRADDLVTETVMNAEAVLEVIASYIRAAREQWAMFYPVWPEALQQMP